MKRITLTVTGLVPDKEFEKTFAPQVPGESIADRLNREAAENQDETEMVVLSATVEDVALLPKPTPEAPSI